MTEPQNTQTVTPVAASGGSGSFLKRELHGTTFLSLEHVAHMVLAVVVPLVLVGAITMALSMWWGVSSSDPFYSGYSGVAVSSVMMGEPVMAISAVAALLVLVPLIIVLDCRTRGEWAKRPGFAARSAYKVPLYGAIGVLGAIAVTIKISLLTVIISSLALIGTGQNIGSLYVSQFLPGLVGYVVVLFALWYVVKLAKGRDHGKTFSAVVGLLAAALCVALLITAVVNLHSAPQHTNPVSPYPYNSSLEDIYN